MKPLYRAQRLVAIEGAAQGLVDIPYETRGVSGRMYQCRRGEAVALMQAREPQRSPHPFSFLLLSPSTRQVAMQIGSHAPGLLSTSAACARWWIRCLPAIQQPYADNALTASHT